MIKKFLSIITLGSLLISSNFGFYSVYAVETNNLSTPWTIEKARHLAKKALFGATQNQINQLFAVGSAENAVNVLFPSKNGPSRTDFETRLSNLINDPGFNPGSNNDMYNYYITKKTFDPYEAKAKFFLIFEDIFSVNNSNSKDITYLDIENTHNLLYSHTLGNYKDMIKKSLLNNGNPGDYSVSKFLDLLNQTDPKKPNENYARELLQLLLMGEYIPTETPDNGGERNYTETDVDVLSKILIGFQSNENTHEVSFDPSINTNDSFEFLEGPLKAGDSFPFYNTASGTVDVQAMKTSIGGNNGLPDNTIDYIFSKRENAIAMFLADKFYRFYVAEDPTRSELDIIAAQIINNNFDLYQSVKWLLAHDIMYSDKSMNAIVYKNPIDLTVGTAKILGLDNMYNLRSTTRTLGWTPYFPGSIFGRDGFDENKGFFNTTTSIRWASEASRLVNELDVDTFINKNNNLNELIANMELKIFGDQMLSPEIRQKLVNFMSLDSEGNVVVFDLNNEEYNKYYTKGLIHLLLTQPEYVLQSGHDIPTEVKEQSTGFYNSDNKLIFAYFGGGFDWLHAIIPKDEYPQYLEKRLTGSLTGTGIMSLDEDTYINSSLAEFKKLFDSGDLKIINRVGTPAHSRGHDSARRMMTSLNNEYSSKGIGIVGNFIQDEDPLKTLVLNRGGVEFRGGKSLNVGSDGLYRITDQTNNDFRIHKINTLKDIYLSRIYPKNLDFTFANGVHIANVAEASVANGGRSGAGGNMRDNFAFAENLFDAGITNVLSMHVDGGYDTHGRQKNGLNKNLKNVAEKTAAFYNAVKDKHNVTIVLYSEFGRTIKINSSEGTDHGKGGGMFILSNNEELKASMPEKIYGNNSFAQAKANRLGVGIDYRSIYTKLFKEIYNQDLSVGLGANYELESYVDIQEPQTDLFRVTFSRDGNNSYARIKFKVDDDNFYKNQASHIQFAFGTDPNDLKDVRYRDIDRYMFTDDENINLRIGRVSSNVEYFYKINLFDNQYNLKTIEGSFISPTVNGIDNQVLNVTGQTRFRKLENRAINGKQILSQDDQIILSSNLQVTFNGEDNISMVATNTGTVVESIEATTVGTMWDGTFLLPRSIPVSDFIDEEGNFGNNKLKNLRVEKVVKVGADTLGVGLNLNKPVEINVPNMSSSKRYTILSSEDGLNWEKLENANIVKNGTNLKFSTDHFTYFAIAESTSNGGEPIIDEDNNDNGGGNDGGNTSGGNTNSSGSRSSGGGGLTRDKCKYGDYSPSYYDKSCGKSVNAKELYKLASKYNNLKNISVNDENDEINYAILELQDYESDKFNIYTLLFSDVNSNSKDQEKVLRLLREDLSTMNVDGYQVHYIKGSNKNAVFKKIAQLFLKGKYSDEYKEKIVKSLNELILAYAVANLEGLTTSIKQKAKNEMKTAVTSLKYNYKLAEASIKSYAGLQPVQRVYTQQTTKKTEEYYKSRKEAILRKHKEKQK